MPVEQKTIRTVITPNDQFLRQVFSVAKAYYIDIYQREYKWTKENVETLLRDIEVHFGQHARTKRDPYDIQAEVQASFEPYFLNTYLTHNTATNIFIVDGQQRLTTLLLVLIKLYKIVKAVEGVEGDATYADRTFSSQTLEKLIFESDDFGDATRFKIFNENREQAFKRLLGSNPIQPKDETQKRILENMATISEYYDHFFAVEGMPGRYDLTKLTYYISYLLDRISIVEIKIEKQNNVAMIFEVVNDRGLGLKPYEILKGKLIGNLPVAQKEHANAVWTQLQDQYYRAVLKNSTEATLDLDMFFRTFFRAKFADSENDYDNLEGDYHYVMYRDPKIRAYFGGFADPDLLYKRITEDFKYFAELYLWLRTTYDNEYLIYNKLLDQNLQYLLVMSHVTVDDPARDEKIKEVARRFERFHTMLRLLDVYESSTFQRMVFPINRDIRNGALSEVKAVFDRAFITGLAEAEVIQKGEAGTTTIADLFTYDRLKVVRHRWPNFSKYVLMRIDRYLAQRLDKPSYAAGPLNELEEHFNKTTRRKFGMHLEHIYAHNDQNRALFTGEDGLFDEQAFNSARNKLGMVLLLKDRQNESSGNEVYQRKFDRYKKSNFIWNELMVGHLDGVDLRNVPAEWFVECIDPDYSGAFPVSKVESRQQSLCAAIKTIWLDEIDGA